MKKLITFIFLSSIAISSIAQSDTSYYTNPNKWSATKPNRVNAAVSLGGGVSFFNSKYASTYTFIAPSIKYRVSPKFAVCAGLIHYNLTGNRFITGGITDNNYLNRNTYGLLWHVSLYCPIIARNERFKKSAITKNGA